jgi:hypothetical protein
MVEAHKYFVLEVFIDPGSKNVIELEQIALSNFGYAFCKQCKSDVVIEYLELLPDPTRQAA